MSDTVTVALICVFGPPIAFLLLVGGIALMGALVDKFGHR